MSLFDHLLSVRASVCKLFFKHLVQIQQNLVQSTLKETVILIVKMKDKTLFKSWLSLNIEKYRDKFYFFFKFFSRTTVLQFVTYFESINASESVDFNLLKPCPLDQYWGAKRNSKYNKAIYRENVQNFFRKKCNATSFDITIQALI